MKVVGVCGSPRKGNTEWMLRKLLERAAEAGADTELILLREKVVCDGLGMSLPYFDNSYSWLTPKNVTVNLEYPER